MSSGDAVDASVLESIRYRGVQDFTLLDQRVLPGTVKYDSVTTLEETWNAIKEMRVRGAPAIAVTAMLGIAVAASRQSFGSVAEASKYLEDALVYISTSRPTAVNLFNAVAQFKAFVNAEAVKVASAQELVAAFVAEAERLLREDTQLNEGIMKHGAAYLLQHCKKADQSTDALAIVTICNTGSLATSKFGTALGVIRELHYQKKLQQVYALETRPWNQGARLTVFECLHERMPTTLLCDSAVSFLMSRRQISACIVGADRICQNGDTANKIGTYDLAVAAKFHGVPFYVAAPTTTLDANTADGSLVHIEERTPTEITHNVVTGQRAIAEDPHGLLTVWNPVFDIVPGALITGGIITEKGVVPPKAQAPYYDIASIIAS